MSINVTGNKDANYIKIEVHDEERIFLEIGDCCMVTFRGYVPNEFLSRVLTGVWFDCPSEGNNLAVALLKKYGWNNHSEYNRKLINMVEEIDLSGNIIPKKEKDREIKCNFN